MTALFLLIRRKKEQDTRYRILAESAPTYEELYKRLAEYENAEENGLLLRLPCKVGDMIWFFMNVDDVVVIREHKIATLTNIVALMENKEFDKTVFLSQERAESALAEMNRQTNAYIDEILQA